MSNVPAIRSQLIVLDCDGVLLDYNAAYPNAWAKAFGEMPALANPEAYWPMDRWNVRRLVGEELDRFRDHFDYSFWSTISAIEDAVDACNLLVRGGYELVCVTALDSKFKEARAQNLRSLGFPIQDCICTESQHPSHSPKAEIINKLMPAAFVDDFAPYLVGIDSRIHRGLVLRELDGSPNTGDLLRNVDSSHTNLMAFAQWWLQWRTPDCN